MATKLADLDPIVAPKGTVDALESIRASLAHGMRAAREAAGLTQEELAARLRRPVEKVAKIESGEWMAQPGHVSQVLLVCGLAEDWKPSA